VVLLDPAWVSYEAAAQMNGAEVIRVSSSAADGFLPDLNKVASIMDDSVKIIVVNSPCNPSGAVFPMDTLRKLAEIAEKHGAILLSDEVYEYQIYDQQHYSPAADFDNVITVNAFSKSFAMTGWRLGYALAPLDIVEGMTKIYTHSTSSVTSFAQWGAIAALESEESPKVVQEIQAEYSRNRSLMIDLINKSDYLDLDTEPQGAFYCFPSYSFNMDSVELATQLLQQCHVATIPGVAFGQCGEGFLRLSYATDGQAIEAGMQRMESFFQKLESEI
jgi:aspartate aminotransferase